MDGASARDTGDKERKAKFQLELFWRELNEVHLLLDFVSGRNDKSLASLTGIPDPAGTAATSLSWDQVVDRICAIRFPPDGTAESKAQDAAFLLMVKDHLNGIADPAKGLTVAYTAMFSGVALGGPPRQQGGAKAVEESEAEGEEGRTDGCDFKRNPPSYAQEAYPNLEAHARQFKSFFDALPWLALVWALITGLVYWDTALSNSILQQITKADTDVVGLLQNNPTLNLADGVCARQITASQAIPCQQLQTLRLRQALARADLAALASEHWGRHAIGTVTRMFAPAELFETTGHGCFSTFSTTIGGSAQGETTPGAQTQASLSVYLRAVKYCEAFSPSALEQMAAAVTSVFSIYIVPMMFGLLGTLAGLVRAITWKVRESTLSPRDHRLFFATIPLGVVAGLAVGLIFSSPGTYTQTVTGLPQAITLSAAAFAFLAGYGADSFFVMIDNLLKRIFSLDKQSNGKS
ncbi:MAG TPA: hypothetical protein VH722_00215 [Alphaproteobacteria bacterium]|nr:hypothetical protein [Alphaproteobacteria bacterium]